MAKAAAAAKHHKYTPIRMAGSTFLQKRLISDRFSSIRVGRSIYLDQHMGSLHADGRRRHDQLNRFG